MVPNSIYSTKRISHHMGLTELRVKRTVVIFIILLAVLQVMNIIIVMES